MRGFRFWLALLVAGLMVATAACDSDSSDDTTAAGGDTSALETQVSDLTAEVEQAKADLAAAEAQLGSAAVTVSVESAGALVAPTEPIAIGEDGWTNGESVRGGLQLIFDSQGASEEGPDSWDVAAHPRVYFTSESHQSNNPNLAEDANFAGYHVIDAYTKEVVSSHLFEYEGNITRGPHGIGVSPDGKWMYVGWAETPEGESASEFGEGTRIGYVAIVNIRTGKMDKLLRQSSYFEGGTRSQAVHHIQCWIDWEGNDRCIIQWGFGANGGPHHIVDPNDNNRVVKSITYDDVKPMGHPFTTPSPDGQYVYISMGANFIRGNHSPAAAVAKLDLATGEHVVIEGTGAHPIGITHTMDGKWTFVVDGHGPVFKIDNETDEVVSQYDAGVAGPYGICLNWDESMAFTVGKGEGTHNLGNNLGVMDVESWRQARNIGPMPIYLGGSAQSVDHCALHPDPEVNEIWVSNMKGWETIVVDLDTYEPSDWIATPNGGDTHGMAFVWYDGGWENGVLHSDMGGPKSPEMKANVAAAVAASASG